MTVLSRATCESYLSMWTYFLRNLLQDDPGPEIAAVFPEILSRLGWAMTDYLVRRDTPIGSPKGRASESLT